ncbi:MAG: magnesium transporter [Phycisphaerales bacterium]|nr:magnesium transporter [Phycisphaerales bacterium]
MLGTALQPDIEELIRNRQWGELRLAMQELHAADIAEIIIDLPAEDEAILFRLLPRGIATEVFSHLPPDHQETLIGSLTSEQTRSILEQMTPDDRTHLFEELPSEVTRRLVAALPPAELKAAQELLGYPPESAGRYMTPRYVTLRPDMSAGEALEHVRRTAPGKETLNILYVVDHDGRLDRDLRLSSLVLASPEQRLSEIDDRPLVAIPATTDREEVLRTFEKYDRFALPVVDASDHMLGIITGDDVLDVASEEATEDIHKIGGMEALDEPYLDVTFLTMIKKRGVWLSVLFIGEMLTASAMAHFEQEIAKALVLMLFVPLIISSGGNSGSQATTLIIRALALTELRLRDWWRVMRREVLSGVALGAWLGFIGFLRVLIWQHFGWVDYGEHHVLVAVTVWLSLIGVVGFGTLAGSMLPFILRAVGLDPATSSAPFVATLVDVSGLIIYFSIAALLLRGTLL